MNEDNNEETDVCPICLGIFTLNKLHKLWRCGHVFCYSCLYGLLTYANTGLKCVWNYCKGSITNKELDTITRKEEFKSTQSLKEFVKDKTPLEESRCSTCNTPRDMVYSSPCNHEKMECTKCTNTTGYDKKCKICRKSANHKVGKDPAGNVYTSYSKI